MTTPNEIALYGLSADGGVTFSEYRELTAWAANAGNDAHPSAPQWVRLCSLPAALNAERNEKALREAAQDLWYAHEALSACVDSGGDASTVALRNKTWEAYGRAMAALNPKEGE